MSGKEFLDYLLNIAMAVLRRLQNREVGEEELP